MFTNKACFYLLLSLVQAILEICLEAAKPLIRHCTALIVYVNKRSSALNGRTTATVQSSSYSCAVLFHCEQMFVL